LIKLFFFFSKLSNKLLLLNLLKKIKQNTKATLQILNNCGLTDEQKKIITGEDNKITLKIYGALIFFNTPRILINPVACNIDPNCSDPTKSPRANIISPDPDNLVA
jgi:hypothetical protein